MVIVTGDNWTLIKNVMLSHGGWVDLKTIEQETNIVFSTIHRIMRVKVKWGEVEKQYRLINPEKSPYRQKLYWRFPQ